MGPLGVGARYSTTVGAGAMDSTTGAGERDTAGVEGKRHSTLLNSVLGENLEDDAPFHQELRSQRSILSVEILGTAITCSTGDCVSCIFMNSTSWSPVCGTGTSRICTKGETSTMCTMVCR